MRTEKTRALFERQGRARDVYDVVHISRNFRDDISAARALQILRDKFGFKKLGEPSVDGIIDRIDAETLRGNWQDQLAHQLPSLPSVDSFLTELREALTWWMAPALALPVLQPVPPRPEERTLPREHFPTLGVGRMRPGLWSEATGPIIDRVRFGARNRLLVRIDYQDRVRVVEPYSIREKRTGNTLLYVWELTRDGETTDQIKAYKLDEIEFARALSESFVPRYAIEL